MVEVPKSDKEIAKGLADDIEAGIYDTLVIIDPSVAESQAESLMKLHELGLNIVILATVSSS